MQVRKQNIFCISFYYLILFNIIIHRDDIFINANSAGDGPACLDAMKLCTLPCPSDGIARAWTTTDMNGVVSPCCPAGMDLVAPPIKSNKYAVTSSSSNGKYEPCELITITVKALSKDAKYLGLLLYAVDNNAASTTSDNVRKVGKWILPKSEDPKFWTPPMCSGKAVMHRNAGVKHFKHDFKFQAPKKGTGSIRFRALVKHGETNGGAFFWPEEDLVLDESTDMPNPTIWIQASEKGISCKTACEKQGTSCDGTALNFTLSLPKDEQFSNEIDGPGNFLACRAPLLSNNGKPCSKLGLLTNEEGYCSTRDDFQKCPVDSNVNNLCEAIADTNNNNNEKRLCPCLRKVGLDTCEVSGVKPGDDNNMDDDNGNTPGDGNTPDDGKTKNGIAESTVHTSSGSVLNNSNTVTLLSVVGMLLYVLNGNNSAGVIVNKRNAARNNNNNNRTNIISNNNNTTSSRRHGIISSRNILTIMIFFTFFIINFASGHNWINNPESRIKGLTKVGPCPPRPGQSINIAVNKNQDFHLEWSIGHPNTFVYISIVKREDEGKLGLNSPEAIEGYITEAPSSAKTWLVGKGYDKTHVRWHTPKSSSKFGKEPLPTAGVGTGERYSKELSSSDSTLYFERPSTWRCTRRHKDKAACDAEGVTYGQYEYKSQYLAQDEKVAYSNPKYPWLVAAAKYKIAYKRPQDYDLIKIKFPEYAEAGEYVIQYSWRGYYDCFDAVLVDPGGTGGGGTPPPPPELVYETVWIKTEHCQYEEANIDFPSNVKGKHKKCFVISSTDDISACKTWCENGMTDNVNIANNKKRMCDALNVVPYKNPSNVVSFLNNDVNIIYNNGQCKQNMVQNGASENSFICYGFFSPTEEPEVGTIYTISDDPSDPIFYSTCYKKEQVARIKSSSGNSNTPSTNSVVPKWHFGDKCISCQQAKANSELPASKVARWDIINDCEKCGGM